MVGEKTIICDLGSKKCRLVLFAKMGVDVWVWGFLLCKYYQVSETREKVAVRSGGGRVRFLAGTPYISKKRKKERKPYFILEVICTTCSAYRRKFGLSCEFLREYQRLDIKLVLVFFC